MTHIVHVSPLLFDVSKAVRLAKDERERET